MGTFNSSTEKKNGFDQPGLPFAPAAGGSGWDSWNLAALFKAGSETYAAQLRVWCFTQTPENRFVYLCTWLLGLDDNSQAVHEQNLISSHFTPAGYRFEDGAVTWQGKAGCISARARFENGSAFDLKLSDDQKMLEYPAVKLDSNEVWYRQAALVHCRLQGTVTRHGRDRQIESGAVWYDRICLQPAIQLLVLQFVIFLPGGDRLLVREYGTKDRAQFILQHADGMTETASGPSALESGSRFFNGSQSHLKYPSSWKAECSDLKLQLKIVLQPPHLDFISIPRLEGVIAFSGTCQGSEVSGYGFIRCFGTEQCLELLANEVLG